MLNVQNHKLKKLRLKFSNICMGSKWGNLKVYINFDIQAI